MSIYTTDVAITTSGFEADIASRVFAEGHVTSPTLENGADTLGVSQTPLLHLKRISIYDTDVAITTSGFVADIAESGLR